MFDEIEKGHEDLHRLLLGILDKAKLTLGDNRVTDFSKSLIFMTSNLGATEMQALLAPKMGFAGPSVNVRGSHLGLHSKIVESANRALRSQFSPEFLNRIDRKVVFHPLTEQVVSLILEIELTALENRIQAFPDGPYFGLSFTNSAKMFLRREGFSSQYGARHLKRVISRLLSSPLANLISSNQIGSEDQIEVDFNSAEGDLVFSKAVEVRSRLFGRAARG